MLDAISQCRALLANKPQDLQLKVLWILLESVAVDTEQLKAYIDALHESFMRYAGAVEAYTNSHSKQVLKLQAEIENLAQEFG